MTAARISCHRKETDDKMWFWNHSYSQIKAILQPLFSLSLSSLFLSVLLEKIIYFNSTCTSWVIFHTTLYCRPTTSFLFLVIIQVECPDMCIESYLAFLFLVVITTCSGAPYQQSNGCGYEVSSVYVISYTWTSTFFYE